MSNDYYVHDDEEIPLGSRARSAQINLIGDNIETGFDLLPSKADIYNGKVNFGTDSGAADAYVVTTTKGMTAYLSGCQVLFLPGAANTGVATVNVDGLGAKTIKQADGNALEAGELDTSNPVLLIYNGTDFYLIAGSPKTTKAYIDAAVAAGGSPGSINFQQLGIGVATANQFARVNAAGNALEGQDLTVDNIGVGTATAGESIRSNSAGTSLVGVMPGFKPVTKSGSYTVLTADNEAWFRCSATLTLTLTAAATLGDGFSFLIENTSSSSIMTIDPDSAELVDGLAAINVLPNEVRLVSCDGAAFTSVVLRGFYQEFTTSGTFTSPLSGYSRVCGLIWGAGGGGAAVLKLASSVASAGGGGGGACNPFTLKASDLSSTVAVAIGAGGASKSRSTEGASFGNVGGNSSFDVVYAYGGGYGGAANSASNYYGGGGGGVLSAGSIGSPGLPGNAADLYNEGFGGAGGSTPTDVSPGDAAYGGGGGSGHVTYSGGDSLYGGGGGGAARPVYTPTYAGGVSVHGGDGGASAHNGTATSGSTPAGAGGAAASDSLSSTATSGAGGDGLLRVWGVM